jgi:hypothetical protein
MTDRSPHVPAISDSWWRVRRRLALHRRPISAVLTFLAVLFGLAAVTTDSSSSTALPGAASSAPEAAPADDELVVPLHLSDPAVAAMLSPGDVVDVMVADHRGDATLVASQLVVTAVPGADDDGPWSDGDGLVMVAADAATTLSLAGAASRGVLTVAIRP